MNMESQRRQKKFHFRKNIILNGKSAMMWIRGIKKLALSTLQETHFVGPNGKNKTLYELSEYLYYFVQWGIINKAEIENLCTFLQNLKNEDFIDSRFVVLHLYFFQYCEETKERILLYRLQTKCLPIVAFYKYLLLKI